MTTPTATSPARGPKIVILGAGSMFFGRQAIHAVVSSPILRTGTLALVDTHAPTLEKMLKLANLAKSAAAAPTTIVGTTNRREVLAGADFVVLTFANDGVRWRGVDTEISARHGVRMCSSDTIGPGGIFRTLREAHEVLAVARDVEALAPKAWVINLINPTACFGILLMRHAPKLRSFAMCDGHHEPEFRRNLLRNVGLLAAGAADPALEAAADIRIAGVNHCTWMTRFSVNGKDYLPAYLDYLKTKADEGESNDGAKAHLNGRYRLEIADIFGVIPTNISHTKEYVPFYQGWWKTPGELPALKLFDAVARAKWRAEIFQGIDDWNAGRKPMESFFAEVRNDHATDVIESMWGKLGKRFYINQPNRGAVTNLAADAFQELRCRIELDGMTPEPVGDLPFGVLSLTRQVLDTHELTVEAAVTCDRKVLRRAMLTDPIVNAIGDADAIIKDMLDAQRSVLPAGWYA